MRAFITTITRCGSTWGWEQQAELVAAQADCCWQLIEAGLLVNLEVQHLLVS
jgi:hypothetical protein